MRSLSAVIAIAALLWFGGFGTIATAVHFPTTGVTQVGVRPSAPVVPFGDDAGGSH